MLLRYYKILSLIFLGLLYSEDAYFDAVSSVSVIDTINPEIIITSPEADSQYYYGQTISVVWTAEDENSIDNIIMYIKHTIVRNCLSIFGGYIFWYSALRDVGNPVLLSTLFAGAKIIFISVI